MVSPNPNNGNFTLCLNYVSNKTKVQIRCSEGKLVLEYKITALETKLNTGLPSGVYNLKVLENTSITDAVEIEVKAI